MPSSVSQEVIHSLPLFPLGVVLFPGGSLPLQVFEERYFNMVGWCAIVGKPFGVIALVTRKHPRKAKTASSLAAMLNSYEPEDFHPIGTLAMISELKQPRDGVMVIRATGTQRFRVERLYQDANGLWNAKARLLPPDQKVEIPPDLKKLSTAMGNLINTYHARNVPSMEMPIHPPYHLRDCAWVANRWCELLPMELVQKQRLMELDNPLVRLELASDLLAKSQIPL